MFKQAIIIAITTFFTVVMANGSVLYLELPEEISAEMVQNPTANDSTIIDSFVIEEVNKVDTDVADRVVILTKDGVPIIEEQRLSEDVAIDESNDRMFRYYTTGEIKISPVNGKWTKREEGSIAKMLDDYIVPQCKIVFGQPVVRSKYGYREVRVVRDMGLNNEWGFYDASRNAIYLQSWPMGEVPSVDEDTKRAHLTRNVLHAFRWRAMATWDHFGSGMVHAAWIRVQRNLKNMKVMTMFNDLNHDSLLPDDPQFERPYYASYEQYNVPELSTEYPSFFPGSNDLNLEIKKARYSTCGYVWWKANRASDGDFIKAFNRRLTDEWNRYFTYNPKTGWRPTGGEPLYGDLKKIAYDAFGSNEIEGMNFSTWFMNQPILNHKVVYDIQLLVTTDRLRAKVFSYIRNSFGEYSNPNPVHVKKLNCWATAILHERDVPLNGGYGSFNFGQHEECAVFDSSTTVLGVEAKRRDFAWAFPMSWRKKFYGILPFQSQKDPFGVRLNPATKGDITVSDDNGNSHTLKYGDEVKAFGFWSDLWDGFNPDESPVLYCHFDPMYPDWYRIRDIPFQEDFILTRDSGEYGLYKPFIGQSYNDSNSNGIDDDDEVEFAKNFMPYIIMHSGNDFIPAPVEVTLDLGSFSYEIYDSGGDVIDQFVYWPSNFAGGMKEIFETYGPNSGRNTSVNMTKGDKLPSHYQYRVNFTKIQPYYPISRENWHVFWDLILTNPDPESAYLRQPTTYVNLFKDVDDIVIQYWFFYPFNDWGNWHEGDWEHINVKVTSSDPSEARMGAVNYYFHKKYRIQKGVDIPNVDGTHPIVYVGGRYERPNRDKLNTNSNILIPDDKVSNIYPDENGFSHKAASGASYWSWGRYINVGILSSDEDVILNGSSRTFEWNKTEGILWELDTSVKGNVIKPYDAYWSDFPGLWGRPKKWLYGSGTPGWGRRANEAPTGPIAHGCYREWIAEGYEYYSDGPEIKEDNSNASSNSSPAFPFALHQSKPNPAKFGETNVAFSVPAGCRATLTVFDITGRKVAVPFDEEVAPGEYTAKINTRSLAAGIYVYKLEAGKDKAIKKMIITY